jgi:hypothetical protein
MVSVTIIELKKIVLLFGNIFVVVSFHIVCYFISLFSPVFSGLFDFCSIYTGASLEGAVRLNQGVNTLHYLIVQ